MTFSLVVNTVSAQATVSLMMRQLQLFEKWEISGTLMAWQLQDMNRHKWPGFKGGPLPHSVSTRIWQHTQPRRRWGKKRKRGRPAELEFYTTRTGKGRLRRKHKRRKVVYQKPEPPTMHRHGKPILRTSLLEICRVRMRDAMKEKITW